MERKVSEFLTAPILADSPPVIPPRKVVVFSAVVFSAVSVFWYLKILILVSYKMCRSFTQTRIQKKKGEEKTKLKQNRKSTGL